MADAYVVLAGSFFALFKAESCSCLLPEIRTLPHWYACGCSRRNRALPCVQPSRAGQGLPARLSLNRDPIFWFEHDCSEVFAIFMRFHGVPCPLGQFGTNRRKPLQQCKLQRQSWLRGWDLNPRPSGYEPDEPRPEKVSQPVDLQGDCDKRPH